jgi:hypothetical protein
MANWLWLGTAFSSAFLLFVVQPLLAKWLLPVFGGSPGTWAACMLFFQVMLLVGYAYAHVLARLPARTALRLHAGAALLAGVFALSARHLPEVDASALSPALRIPVLLGCLVGPSYLLVASTAPLLSHWAAQLGAALPHRLYAISNAGSLLGLLGYPLLIEAALPIARQHALWCSAVALFSLVSAGCALWTLRGLPRALLPLRAASPPSLRQGAYWAACAAVPSVLLLAVTNHITVDVAPMPLLWVVPLALYLLSFIAAFSGKVSPWRGWLVPLWIVASLGLGYNAFAEGNASLVRQLGFALTGLFAACLLCHDALIRARGAPEQLTGFYLSIALGGALGGAFVSLIAPWLFRDYYELEIAALLVYALLWLDQRGEARALGGITSWERLALADALALSAGLDDEAAPFARAPAGEDGHYDRAGRSAAQLEADGGRFAVAKLEADGGLSARVALRRRRRWLSLGSGMCVPLLMAALVVRAGGWTGSGRVLERRRSFLGSLRVTQFDFGTVLTHGRIQHGMQLRDPARSAWPTMYFGPGTAVARVLREHAPGRPRVIGVVGLGVGTLAAYGRSGDTVHFYELDPNVLDIASRWFTFLRDSPARVDVELGDGRLLLARSAARFDVLVLDAFASDAVPVHLLTREAFALYSQHLAAGGMLLANVSNRHLAVDRVVRAAARSQGLACRVINTGVDRAHFVSKVRWAVMSRDANQLAAELTGLPSAANSVEERLWTDARASLWSILH